MEELIEELRQYMEFQKTLHSNDDYKSYYEIGVNAGVNETIKDIEEIISKHV